MITDLIKDCTFESLVSEFQNNTDKILYTVENKLMIFDTDIVDTSLLTHIPSEEYYEFKYREEIFTFYDERILSLLIDTISITPIVEYKLIEGLGIEDNTVKFMRTSDYVDGWETSDDDIIGTTIEMEDINRTPVLMGIV